MRQPVASEIDDSGAISRWVGGGTSNSRYVFLSHVSKPNLKPGETTTVQLYVLCRAFQRVPLEDFEYVRKSSTREVGRLNPTSSKPAPFEHLEPVPVPTMLAIDDVAHIIRQIFNDPTGPFPGAGRVGNGSVFLDAYRLPQALLEAAKPGLREVQTIIYCDSKVDLRLHSKFRVD